MDEQRDAPSVLARLRRMGVALSLDDFGVGYASIDRLRRFLFDRIKIDRSFIAGLTTGAPTALALVRAIAHFAADPGIRATAEGVETREQLDCASAAGVGEARGFVFRGPFRRPRSFA